MNEDELIEEEVVAVEETQEAIEDALQEVDERLTDLVDEFGREDGLDYYLAGKTLEEARKEDYEKLKAKFAEGLEEEKKDENAECSDCGTDDEEKKELRAVVKGLRSDVALIKKSVAALSSKLSTGNRQRLSTGKPVEKLDPLARMAAKYHRDGVKRR